MSAPQKAQSPVGAGQCANEKADTAVVAQSLEQRKHEATLMARLALPGHAVHRVADGYLVCRQGYVKHCADLQALESFAVQVGVRR